MHVYEVGKLYNPNKTKWSEGVQFSIRKGQCELLLFFDNPNFAERSAVKSGECEFGVLKIESVIFFLYRFGDEIAWSDQPFSMHLVADDERGTLPILGEDTRLTLSIILVNAANGKTEVIRLVSLAPEFSAELVRLVSKQSKEIFDSTIYDKQIGNVYRRFPNARFLVDECFAFTKGGI